MPLVKDVGQRGRTRIAAHACAGVGSSGYDSSFKSTLSGRAARASESRYELGCRCPGVPPAFLRREGDWRVDGAVAPVYSLVCATGATQPQGSAAERRLSGACVTTGATRAWAGRELSGRVSLARGVYWPGSSSRRGPRSPRTVRPAAGRAGAPQDARVSDRKPCLSRRSSPPARGTATSVDTAPLSPQTAADARERELPRPLPVASSNHEPRVRANRAQRSSTISGCCYRNPNCSPLIRARPPPTRASSWRASRPARTARRPARAARTRASARRPSARS
jgi:hypothetical protein